jgi:peptide/nickel transport system permease protein
MRAPPGRARRFWRRLRRHRPALLSAALLAVLAASSLAAPLVSAALGVDSSTVDLLNRFGPPSPEHPLGTDELGRDVLLRLLEGGRVSLFVGLAAALVAAIIGTAIGLVAGWRGGLVDAVLMRLTDSVIALPLLPLLIVLAALDLRKLGVPEAIAGSDTVSLYRIVALIALVGWTTVARLVRGAALSLRARDFVRAAEALGARAPRIVLVHVLPNVASPIVVATTLSVGHTILLESALSFLGLGIQPPEVDLGFLIANGEGDATALPWLFYFPSLFLIAAILSVNFIGDGLRDALDPTQRIRT